MPARTRGRGRVAPSWTYTQAAAATQVNGASSVLLFTLTPIIPLDLTILRTHVTINTQSDQGVAVEDNLGAFGMCVVTDRAAAAGIASLPTPVTDGGDDVWFVHQPLIRLVQILATGTVQDEIHFSSKAMRKIEGGQVVVGIVENAHATEGFQFFDAVRMLTKLTQG